MNINAIENDPIIGWRKRPVTNLSGSALNAMTVDVEDYFQVEAFANHIAREEWNSRECRVERNMDRILQLFSDNGTTATFFTLGWIAERYPQIVRRIVGEGHELASHGLAHFRADHQSRPLFLADVKRAKELLEDVGGTAVNGYRATSFSITRRNLWALSVLEEVGYKYSSSTFPIHHDLYGIPEQPRFAFFPFADSNFVEIPITTIRKFGRNWPAGGGGYFRLFPYSLFKRNLQAVRAEDRQPCTFYFHPWEIDHTQPRITGTSVKTRVRHYLNLDRTFDRLQMLLKDFRWSSVNRVFFAEFRANTMTRSSLFLCHRLPYPPNKGDKIRSYALLRHLARRGPVHLACFVDDADDLQYLDKVRELAGGRCYFERLGANAKAWRSLMGLVTGKPLTTACFGSDRLQAWVNQTLKTVPIDDVVVFGSAMAPYLLRAPTAPDRVLFDMVDIDSDKWRQYAARSRGAVKWLYGREAEKLQALECRAAGAFGHTLLASDFEADTFKTTAPASAGKITGLTNGVDLDRFSPGNFENPFGKDELPIVMTGRMDYRPNYEGALWFAREVLPQVLKFIPNARVHFVGSGPPAQLRDAAGAGVVVTGAVADVRPYIQFAGAIIAPLHIARGIQNKVLEAMAMAKPVVATHDATRSLGVKAGYHLWVENEPRRFANAVVEALQGPDRDALARNGRNYVEVHHSWAGLMKDFERHLELLHRADICGGPVVPSALPGQQLEFSAPCKS